MAEGEEPSVDNCCVGTAQKRHRAKGQSLKVILAGAALAKAQSLKVAVAELPAIVSGEHRPPIIIQVVSTGPLCVHHAGSPVSRDTLPSFVVS